ncbi:hypothetical protein [Nocardioides yefusunii]|uniref:DUF2568 domain-containing protein n=1 Tax=Nocardioides yefusunii TaxID=2500546 RepID=A0ABW1QZ74_9ACTN|nr:hypothetical protein [Nocardioides yefusunii]
MIAPLGKRPTGVPWPLRVALAIVLVEVVALVVLGVAELLSLNSDRLAMGLTTALFFLGWGAVLAACSVLMWKQNSSGRSLVVLGQLIQLGLAWSYRDSTPDLAGALGATALVVLIGVFWRSSLAWFEED